MNAFFETTNGFNFQIIDPLIGSRGVRLTWFDCKVIQRADNSIQWIKCTPTNRFYPLDKIILSLNNRGLMSVSDACIFQIFLYFDFILTH